MGVLAAVMRTSVAAFVSLFLVGIDNLDCFNDLSIKASACRGGFQLGNTSFLLFLKNLVAHGCLQPAGSTAARISLVGSCLVLSYPMTNRLLVSLAL